jgi:uncharacterized protein with PQ loop repeat
VSVSVSIQTLAGSAGLSGLGSAAGYLGAALGVVMLVPQLARTYRDRALLGVSALTWALTALSCLTWLLYGVRADELPQIPGNVLMIVGTVLIVLAVPSPTGRPARAGWLLLAAVVLLGLATVVPPAALGVVGFGIGIASTLPQIVRSLSGPAGAAVSIPTWLLYGVAQLFWLTYAVTHHDLIVAISAVFLIVSAVLVSGSEWRRRTGRRASPVPDQTTAAARVASLEHC